MDGGYQDTPLPTPRPIPRPQSQQQGSVSTQEDAGSAPGALHTRCQQAARICTQNWEWFQGCLHSREVGPGMPGSPGRISEQTPTNPVSFSLHGVSAAPQRPSEAGPVRPILQESGSRLQSESEDLPEVTQQVRAGLALRVCPCAPAPPGEGIPGLLPPRRVSPPTAHSTAPAGGLVTPSLRETGDGGLQRPLSPLHPSSPPGPAGLGTSQRIPGPHSIRRHQQV